MECLITKLKGTVNDSSLLGLNEFRFNMSILDLNILNLVVRSVNDKPFTLRVINGAGGISLTKGSGYTSSIEISSSGDTGSTTTVYFQSVGNYELSIDNKHNVEQLRTCPLEGEDNIAVTDVDFDKLEWLENSRVFVFNTNNKQLSNIEKIFSRYTGVKSSAVLVCYNTVLNGDFDEFVKGGMPAQILGQIGSELKGTITELPSNVLTFLNSSIAASLLSINLADEYVAPSTLRAFNTPSIVPISLNLKSLASVSVADIGFGSSINSNVIRHFKGNISALKSNSSIIRLHIKNFVQDDDAGLSLNEAPANFDFLTCESNTDIIPIANRPKVTWSNVNVTPKYFIAVEGVHFATGTADFIKAMSTKNFRVTPTQSFLKSISIALADDLTSSAASGDSTLQSAISTLQGKGVTVSIGYSDTAINGIALMSAREATKYGIVYKGKELIVEPADTSKTLIAPANDCTYKEFNSLEEAKAFVSSNGLVKVESK